MTMTRDVDRLARRTVASTLVPIVVLDVTSTNVAKGASCG